MFKKFRTSSSSASVLLSTNDYVQRRCGIIRARNALFLLFSTTSGSYYTFSRRRHFDDT